MKPADIKVGTTYINKGAGRTKRKVLAIGKDVVPRNWYSSGPRPEGPGVLYLQDGNEQRLYLNSFAAWCGKEEE